MVCSSQLPILGQSLWDAVVDMDAERGNYAAVGSPTGTASTLLFLQPYLATAIQNDGTL